MSVPYSLGPEPTQPATAATAPTEQIRSASEDTKLLAAECAPEDAIEGAPETFLQIPTKQQRSGNPTGGADGAATASSSFHLPDPSAGHDGKLPDRICPTGYGRDDES